MSSGIKPTKRELLQIAIDEAKSQLLAEAGKKAQANSKLYGKATNTDKRNTLITNHVLNKYRDKIVKLADALRIFGVEIKITVDVPENLTKGVIKAHAYIGNIEFDASDMDRTELIKDAAERALVREEYDRVNKEVTDLRSKANRLDVKDIMPDLIAKLPAEAHEHIDALAKIVKENL